jgi:hypothetical protein
VSKANCEGSAPGAPRVGPRFDGASHVARSSSRTKFINVRSCLGERDCRKAPNITRGGGNRSLIWTRRLGSVRRASERITACNLTESFLKAVVGQSRLVQKDSIRETRPDADLPRQDAEPQGIGPAPARRQ